MNRLFEWWWSNMLYFRAEDNILAAGFLLLIPITFLSLFGVLVILLISRLGARRQRKMDYEFLGASANG